MCGIAGLADFRGTEASVDVLKRMSDALAHRGPDGEGHLVAGPIGIAHRRLAVIDLSDAAHQPISGRNPDLALTYNGELFNFRELRSELEALGYEFRSRGDSEVVINAYDEWGPACVERFNGMFALAVHDRRAQRVVLARDRYGVKPLYWYYRDGLFLFASEIKAMLAHPDVRADVCYGALNEYFSFQNIFTDRTLFEGVRLLPPGHLLTVDVPERCVGEPTPYWDYPFPAASAAEGDGSDAAATLQELFSQAVTRQLVADVPVGAYLSGGLDSGSIAAVASRHLPRLHTFTGGFDLSSATGLELGFDERPAAEAIANAFKTEHYEVVMHAGDMECVLPELTWHLEDLRVGQSYPNYYVARLASKFVTVVLSGAGGDELFAGYPWRYYRGVTAGGKDDYLSRYYGLWQRLVSDDEKSRLFNDDTQRRIGELSAFDAFRSVFDRYPAGFDDREACVTASLYFELKTFLPGLLLVEDKLSMAHGLETRVPFLDNDLVDFAVRMPTAAKLRGFDAIQPIDEDEVLKRQIAARASAEGKLVLREAMEGFLPRAVLDRRKQGFSAPDASWFRGESIDYINGLLRDRRALLYEFLQPGFVRGVLDEHISGRVNHRLLIWSLLSFEWWCRTFLAGTRR